MTVAPKTAARIRAYVNEHKDLKHIIQFNSAVGTAGGAAGAALGGGEIGEHAVTMN